MPFDLHQAAHKLRSRHGDALGFRFALLDLLFAVGCGVRETAVALPCGDALCIRTAGPAAPIAGKRMILLAIDAELPGPVASDPAGRWPLPLQTLGGPAVAVSWLAALHSLMNSQRQRPWELIYLRGPALGLADFVEALLHGTAEADVAVLLPATTGECSDLDLVRLDLSRPRNVWRFPACDHTVAISGRAPLGQAWPQIRRVLAGLGPAAAWTLHDLAIAAGEDAAFSAVLRASVAPKPADGLTIQPLPTEARLLFPVNDALAALSQLAERLPAQLADAWTVPLHATTQPNGLRVHALVPAIAFAEDWPDRAGALTAEWLVEPLARKGAHAQRLLAVTAQEAQGPVPAGLPDHAVLWRTPIQIAQDDAELPALQRALAAALRESA